MSASRISALRLVDGTGRVCGGRIRGDKKDGDSVGAEATSGMYASIATVEQPPRKDPQMEYSKIVPQSEQKY
nr:hypothetical protein [Tanacetum cinerariifolium]